MTDTEQQFVIANVTELPLETFDGFHTMIVDSPYSEYVHKNMASHGVHGRGSVSRDCGFDFLDGPTRMYLARIAGRLPRWSVVFTDHESTHLWRADVQQASAEYVRIVPHAPAEYEGFLPWVRWSQPQLSGDRPPQGSEAVLHFHGNTLKRTNCRGSLTAYTNRCLRFSKDDPKHPTEKPLDLLLDMVSWWSDPGENIVDPMAGSGTTALACKLLGRSCLAIERDPQWQYTAERRLSMQWSKRDRDRATEWVASVTAESNAMLRKPPAANGEDVNTRRRAQCRFDDAQRVLAWL